MKSTYRSSFAILYEEKSRHSYFLKRMYCMQFSGYNKSMLFLKDLLILCILGCLEISELEN